MTHSQFSTQLRVIWFQDDVGTGYAGYLSYPRWTHNITPVTQLTAQVHTKHDSCD